MKRLAKIVLATSIFFPVFSGLNHASAASVGEEIVETSKTFIGTPYRFGGTTPSGFDCSGFIRYVFKNEGIDLPRVSADQYKAGKSVSKDELVPGDAVFFETYKPGPSHSGIYVGDNKFIHASSSNGVMVSSLDDKYYWKDRYLGAKRYTQEDKEGYLAGLEVRNGQIGVIEVTKPINLWERDENNKLTMVRVLNPGEKYRVYVQDSLYGGQYGLGANMYITNMPTHINYYCCKLISDTTQNMSIFVDK